MCNNFAQNIISVIFCVNLSHITRNRFSFFPVFDRSVINNYFVSFSFYFIFYIEYCNVHVPNVQKKKTNLPFINCLT